MNKGPGPKVPGLQRLFHRILRLSLDARKTLANVSIRGSNGAKFGRLLEIDSNRERPRGKHIWWTVNGSRESGKSSEGAWARRGSSGSGRAKLRARCAKAPKSSERKISRPATYVPAGSLAPQRHPTESRTVNDSKDQSKGGDVTHARTKAGSHGAGRACSA